MGIYNDEFDGVGGSYLVDPKTGKRTRVEAPTVDHPDGNMARHADGQPVETSALAPAQDAPAAAAAPAAPSAPAEAPAQAAPAATNKGGK